MSKNAVLIYTAEGHPTALRCTRFRKRFGLPLFHRDIAAWNPGRPARQSKSGSFDPGQKPDIEKCRLVVVEDGESALARAYEDAGIPVRVLKPRRTFLPPAVIDLDASDRIEKKGEDYLGLNRPPSAAGQRRLKEKNSKRRQIL
jgi:hypothetical protein